MGDSGENSKNWFIFSNLLGVAAAVYGLITDASLFEALLIISVAFFLSIFWKVYGDERQYLAPLLIIILIVLNYSFHLSDKLTSEGGAVPVKTLDTSWQRSEKSPFPSQNYHVVHLSDGIEVSVQEPPKFEIRKQPDGKLRIGKNSSNR